MLETPIDFGIIKHNTKALYEIFIIVCASDFRLISKYEIAKDTWYVLKVTDKGTQLLKDFKV